MSAPSQYVLDLKKAYEKQQREQQEQQQKKERAAKMEHAVTAINERAKTQYEEHLKFLSEKTRKGVVETTAHNNEQSLSIDNIDNKVRRELISNIQADGTLNLNLCLDFDSWDDEPLYTEDEKKRLIGTRQSLLIEVIQLLKESHARLVNLDLQVNIVDEAKTKDITAALTGNTSLTSLKLRISGNALDLDSRISGITNAKGIATALTHNTSLTSLQLDWSNIGDVGAQEIAAALTGNTSLTSLRLAENHIGTAGARSIAALIHNTSLTSLDLLRNHIGDAGAQDLAAALTHNTSLTNLELFGNQIGDAGATDLAAALTYNISLTSLRLEGNNISNEGAKSIAFALEYNSSLTILNLNYNNTISNEGAKDFATVLIHNTSLTSLWLGGNRITGVRYLADALSHNTSLTELDLDRAMDPYRIEDTAEIKRICNKNAAIAKRVNLNWSRIAILTAFYRANETNALRHSVMPLISEITRLAENRNEDSQGYYINAYAI